MAFADLSLNINLEVSPEELREIDSALDQKLHIMGSGANPILVELSSHIKVLIEQSDRATEFLNQLEKEEVILPQQKQIPAPVAENGDSDDERNSPIEAEGQNRREVDSEE